MSGNFKRENREIPLFPDHFDWERSANVSDGTVACTAVGSQMGRSTCEDGEQSGC